MPTSPRHAQEGAVLIVVLILLLVLTLLGLASLRGTVMEERMTANLRDRGLGFQAAEAALREAEARILANGHAGFPAAGAGGCNGPLCDTPDGIQADRWWNAAAAYWTNANAGVGNIAIRPQYFVEYMGEAPSWPKCDSEIPVHPLCLKPRYRVSARSSADDRATVILQSNFAGP
ncbi:pilus assembly protein [Lysobacter spongiae]|uniref:Pilus assembly protein n=2 Tax=Marilutibacter spongiae TaxID=2025720 RepID=A0A7W3TL43_9GAMM|nr:pilus assembly protein [Lysobacter spongiae]